MNLTTSRPLGPGPIEAALRYRYLIATIAVLSGLFGYLGAASQPAEYEATATLVLGVPQGADLFLERGRSQQDFERDLIRQTARVESSDVLREAADRLGSSWTTRDLRERVRAEADTTTNTVGITAEAGSADAAAAAANAVAAAYRSVIEAELAEAAARAITELNLAREQARARLIELQAALDATPEDGALQAEFEVATQQLVAISARAQQLALEAALYGAGVESFEPAEPPLQRSRPQPLRTSVAAGVLGLLAAGAFAWWKADRDVLADSSADVAAVLNAPLLGEVPMHRRGQGGPAGDGLDAQSLEAYRLVATSLDFSLSANVGRSVIITSVSAGDGKTVTALNVARAAAADGLRVALLDGDVRASGLTKHLQAEGLPGDVVLWGSAGQQLGSSVTFVPSDLLSGGTTNAVGRPEFRTTMEGARDRADLVMVDTPPLALVSDALWMANQTDGVVMVVSRGASLAALQDIKERLAPTGTPIVGFVFNRSKRIRHGSAADTYYNLHVDPPDSVPKGVVGRSPVGWRK